MIVSGYELLGRVSATRAGGVWQARDVSLGRLVAVKALDAGAGGFETLRSEAKVLARIDDEHVVRVYELVEQEGAAYLIEEWIDGATLESVLRAGAPLRPVQALAVMRGALIGLGAAHRAGIVHGDLSPANIIVDRTGTSKLIDFGLAGPTGTPGAPSSGTVGFGAPELHTGVPRTPRSDVYSAAAVLRALLGGSADAVPSGAGPALRAVLARATSPEPADRYPDAAAFLAALEDECDRALGAGWWQTAGLAALVTTTTVGTLTAIGAGASDTNAGAAAAAVSAAPSTRRTSTPAEATTSAPPVAARTASRTKRLLAAAGTVVVVATVAIVLAVANRDEPEPVAAATPPSTTTSTTSTVSATTTSTTTTTTTSTSEAPPTTESAAPPPPSTEAASPLAAAGGFNGVYQGNEIVTAMSGPFHESVYVGLDYGSRSWTVTTSCAADSCVAAITSSSGRQFSFVTADGVNWTSDSAEETNDCLSGEGTVIGSVPVRIERFLTTTAVDQGRVTGVRSDVVISSLAPCEGLSELTSYSTQVALTLTG